MPPDSTRSRKKKTAPALPGLPILLAVLAFAVVFPVVARFTGISTATIAATLAALPGLIRAAYGQRR